ncbi:MAG: D-alanyl-D-alanine carboxypeptidase [Clostridiaceae bacterium]|nr:D-alanyl-D-alanine carboxypeptidase [Clostridiaceae bacterium]
MKQKCRSFFVLVIAICLFACTVSSGLTSQIEAPDEQSDVSITIMETNAQNQEGDDTEVSETPKFTVDAKAAILIEADTGKVLYTFNEHEPLPIASITKIMTMLLVMEAIDSGKIAPTDSVTVSAYASKMGGSQVYLKEGEVFTVEELLKAVAVHSANDASVALAEAIAGSEEAFVSMMNEKAEELGMKNTRFLDCTGLTDEGHYSTAADVAIMSRELIIKHPKIIHYTTIWHDTFRDGTFDLDNTNKLVKRYKGTTGIKTGFTNAAGFCLSASAEREGTKLISVLLGAKTNDLRFSESARLLNYGFSNWESVKIEKKGLEAGVVKVRKGIVTEIPVTYSEDAIVVVKKGSKDKITETLEIPEVVNAPVVEGQTIGVLNIDIDGERLASIPVKAAKNSERCTLVKALGMLLNRWLTLSIR